MVDVSCFSVWKVVLVGSMSTAFWFTAKMVRAAIVTIHQTSRMSNNVLSAFVVFFCCLEIASIVFDSTITVLSRKFQISSCMFISVFYFVLMSSVINKLVVS